MELSLEYFKQVSNGLLAMRSVGEKGQVMGGHPTRGASETSFTGFLVDFRDTLSISKLLVLKAILLAIWAVRYKLDVPYDIYLLNKLKQYIYIS